MAKILNTTLRPINLSVSFKDVNSVLRSRPTQFIPGIHQDVPDADLETLRSQKGFARYEKAGWLVVSDVAVNAGGVKASDGAKKLAAENGIELESLTPNALGNITVDTVKAAIEAKSEL